MFVRRYKGSPDTHIIQFENGKVKRHGRGLSFFYMPLTTVLMEVPMVSQDVPFVFTETTVDHQEVALQGVMTYRITDPLLMTASHDFTIGHSSKMARGDGQEKLTMRLVNAIQGTARTVIAEMTLEQALAEAANLSVIVTEAVSGHHALHDAGIMVEALHFSSVRAMPEIQKALQTDYRERLQKQADDAIYARRASAIENERELKQRELATDVEIEQRRVELVNTQVRNKLAEAEADAKAERMKLEPYGEVEPQVLIGLALKDWAGHEGSIGNLTITPDMLSGLAGWMNSTSAAKPDGISDEHQPK
ncbi:SPFH domain-containing protein [Anderseniella sp. Alg231-50]|uniref:SPFH domain-containing protein n=1 Tax=Anderseniella sp. Alg231-50 TaxID=1922226 RepID=UPI00307C211B